MFLQRLMLWQRRIFFGEVFLEKQWKSSLQNDCDGGHGTVILLLGATAWREDVLLLLSLVADIFL